MKSELAGDLVTTHTISPGLKTFRHHCVPGQPHPSADRAQLLIFDRIEKAFLIIGIKELADNATLAAQGKENHHQCDYECRPHDDEVTSKETNGAAVGCGAIPGCVQQNSHDETEYGHYDFHEPIV